MELGISPIVTSGLIMQVNDTLTVDLIVDSSGKLYLFILIAFSRCQDYRGW